MMIDEIINRIFQQNILELKFSAFSDAFFKRTTRASPFPCVFHQTIIKEQVTILQLHMQIQNYFLENSFFLFDFTSLNFLGKYSSDVWIELFPTTGNLNALLEVHEFVRQYV